MNFPEKILFLIAFRIIIPVLVRLFFFYFTLKDFKYKFHFISISALLTALIVLTDIIHLILKGNLIKTEW